MKPKNEFSVSCSSPQVSVYVHPPLTHATPSMPPQLAACLPFPPEHGPLQRGRGPPSPQAWQPPGECLPPPIEAKAPSVPPIHLCFLPTMPRSPLFPMTHQPQPPSPARQRLPLQFSMLLKRERPQLSVSLAPAKPMFSKLSDVGPLQQLQARFAGQPCEPNPAPQPLSSSEPTSNFTGVPSSPGGKTFQKIRVTPRNFSRLSLILGMVLILLGIAFNSPSARGDERLPHSSRYNNDSLNFRIKSDYHKILHLKFFSRDYKTVWPARDRVYVIDDYEYHDYSLNCEYGEKICYGAWVKGDKSTYWGIGPREPLKNAGTRYQQALAFPFLQGFSKGQWWSDRLFQRFPSGDKGCKGCCNTCGYGDPGPRNLTD